MPSSTSAAKTLSGQQEKRGAAGSAASTRWRAALGEALGKLYVERHFPPEAKARMDELVKNLRAAFKQGIDDLEWMSPDDQGAGAGQAGEFTVKIGYPDKWRDYSALQPSRRTTWSATLSAAPRSSYDDNVDAARQAGRPQASGA